MATCKRNASPSCQRTATIAIVLILAISNLPSPASSLLTVDPVHQAVEVGENAVFVCTSDKGSPDSIVWTFSNIAIPGDNANNKNSPPGSNPPRASNVNGTLKIRNATETDKGWYVCSLVTDPATGKSDKLKVQLVVYEMPGYLGELLGVGVACAVLTLLVLFLYVRRMKREKRSNMSQKMHKGMADPDMNVFTVQKEGKPEYEF